MDGIDGCGKSTQAARLVRALGESTGTKVHHLREPGSTPLGEKLRELVLSRELDLAPAVETLLFAAARRQMLDQVVGPAIARGEHVVCERFHPSTFAYQSTAGGLPEADVLALLERWAGAPRPDLLVWLDLPVERAAARRPDAGDRIEDKGPAFQRRVAEGYRRYAALDPRVVRVDADAGEDEVAARVLAEVTRAL
jgi:dTMP kinase